MPGVDYICHQITLARVLTDDDVTATGGVWNGDSFVAGDYLIVSGHITNHVLSKSTFEGDHYPNSYEDPTNHINQYICSDYAGVVDNGDGTYTVYMDGSAVTMPDDAGFDSAYTLYT
jgi:hypothetical protein